MGGEASQEPDGFRGADLAEGSNGRPGKVDVPCCLHRPNQGRHSPLVPYPSEQMRSTDGGARLGMVEGHDQLLHVVQGFPELVNLEAAIRANTPIFSEVFPTARTEEPYHVVIRFRQVFPRGWHQQRVGLGSCLSARSHDANDPREPAIIEPMALFTYSGATRRAGQKRKNRQFKQSTKKTHRFWPGGIFLSCIHRLCTVPPTSARLGRSHQPRRAVTRWTPSPR
jgi:hypothetical protein